MSKTLTTAHYPVIEVIWARYFFAFVFMLAMFLPRSGSGTVLHSPPARYPGGARPAAVLLVPTSIYGIAYMPLATAAAVSLSSPIDVTALVGAAAGRMVGPRRWAAVAVGFVGALIVVRPGHEAFDWHVLLIVASTVCSAFYQIFSRRYGQTERPDASATVATIVGTVAASPLLPFEWVTPTWGWDLALFVGMGVMAGVGLSSPGQPRRRGVALQLHAARRRGHPGLPGVQRFPRLLDLGGGHRDHRLGPLYRLSRAGEISTKERLTRHSPSSCSTG
jgi:drug/metabolite transporter (DMT)-like permease